VLIRNVADYSIERGFANIYRRDYDRTTSVTADIDKDVTTSNKVNKALEKELHEWRVKYPAYRFTLGGEYTKTKESFASLGRAFLVAILVIYMILGAQFRSFLQPLIIMFTVPFSFIGVIVGLLVIREPFSLVAFIGVVALAGIVVNDSLILVDFINSRRDAGVSKWRAIVKSGVIRMRPIMLTTITTIFGLLPMAIGIGGKSNVWSPLANSIIWGLAFATFLTLFFIPALYAIMGEVGWERKLRRRD
jgi:multidrug efflux pump subunit AcrB